MEETVEFQTKFGLTKSSLGIGLVVQVLFWLLFSVTVLQNPPDTKNGWGMYALLMGASPIIFYLLGLIFAVQERRNFNYYRKFVTEQEEEEQRERNALFDLVVRKFSPTSISFVKDAEFPSVAFETGGVLKTICKMGDTYYEVVDLD